MLLGYIDDSGINYKTKNNFFTDGPYIIWTAILISEKKYFHTERLYYDLAHKILGVKDWRNNELHATDIWQRQNNFKDLSENKARQYFEELFQLLKKLNIQVIIGIQQKNVKRHSKVAKKKEAEYAIYAFLSCLEHTLSSFNETAILISDETSHNKDMQNSLYERTKWRYNPGSRKKGRFMSKFFFENESCFLLDQIHYVQSSESLFVQLADNVSYVINRILTYSYLDCLKAHNKPKADITKVPITPATFKFFADCFYLANYDKKLKDVNFFRPSDGTLLAYTGPDNFIGGNVIRPISEFN